MVGEQVLEHVGHKRPNEAFFPSKLALRAGQFLIQSHAVKGELHGGVETGIRRQASDVPVLDYALPTTQAHSVSADPRETQGGGESPETRPSERPHHSEPEPSHAARLEVAGLHWAVAPAMLLSLSLSLSLSPSPHLRPHLTPHLSLRLHPLQRLSDETTANECESPTPHQHRRLRTRRLQRSVATAQT